MPGQIIDMLAKLPKRKVEAISAKFEQIIASQIHLMLQRGVPAKKLIQMVKEIDGQMKAETAEMQKASGE